MRVNRKISYPENPKDNDDRKRKRTLGKLFSAFSRSKKTPSNSSSTIDVVDVQRIPPSPRVNISSVSSSSSYGEQRNNQGNARTKMAGISADLATGKQYVSTELSEKGTQTAALPSAPGGAHYRRHQLPPDPSYSSYSKYNGGYSTGRVPKCEVERRYPAEVAAAAAAPSWRRPAGRHHQPTVTASDRYHKRSSANEMDILSFFDTGSVDHGYPYKCNKDSGAANSDALFPARDPREGITVHRLSSSESQSRQQLMLEDKDVRSIDHHYPSQRHNHTDGRPVDDCAEDASCVEGHDKRSRPAPFHLQTVKNSHQPQGGPTSFWYCEKMDKNKSKRIPDANECEPAVCCENIVEPTKLQQTRGGGGTIFNRQITTEEKRRLAKIGAIILATAGVAALFMLMVKYKRQAQLCRSMLGDDCDAGSSDRDTCEDDDDDGVCIFEKFDKVKCQNNNFKAMMSNSEKLVEHDDKVCASQDFRKVTKRLKDQSETKPRDIFCPCTDKVCGNMGKKKCF